jgi:putative endonuclease
MAKHNEIGKIGEKITETFLMKHRFFVLQKNFRTRFGEIDIIAEKDNIIHFIEVKSKEVASFGLIEKLAIKPEDNFTKEKFRKVTTSAEIYLQGKGGAGEWQIDLACVYVNRNTREGRVVLLQNVHVE